MSSFIAKQVTDSFLLFGDVVMGAVQCVHQNIMSRVVLKKSVHAPWTYDSCEINRLAWVPAIIAFGNRVAEMCTAECTECSEKRQAIERGHREHSDPVARDHQKNATLTAARKKNSKKTRPSYRVGGTRKWHLFQVSERSRRDSTIRETAWEETVRSKSQQTPWTE